MAWSTVPRKAFCMVWLSREPCPVAGALIFKPQSVNTYRYQRTRRDWEEIQHLFNSATLFWPCLASKWLSHFWKGLLTKSPCKKLRILQTFFQRPQEKAESLLFQELETSTSHSRAYARFYLGN